MTETFLLTNQITKGLHPTTIGEIEHAHAVHPAADVVADIADCAAQAARGGTKTVADRPEPLSGLRKLIEVGDRVCRL